MIANGGIWAIVVLVVGLAALVSAVMYVSGRSKMRDFSSRLTSSCLMVGVAGTAMGLYQGGLIPDIDVVQLSKVIGISMSPLFLAMCMSFLSTILLGIGGLREE